jgi:hypothetical protein
MIVRVIIKHRILIVIILFRVFLIFATFAEKCSVTTLINSEILRFQPALSDNGIFRTKILCNVGLKGVYCVLRDYEIVVHFPLMSNTDLFKVLLLHWITFRSLHYHDFLASLVRQQAILKNILCLISGLQDVTQSG